MAKPIVLTEYGETLDPYYDDSTPIFRGCCVGKHEVCQGAIVNLRVSKTHFILYCDKCGLRILVPKTVTTHEQLYWYFWRKGYSSEEGIVK